MLLMVEKGIRGGIYHSIYRCSKANNKFMKDYDKKKFPVNNFEWTKDSSQLNEDFTKKL